MAVLFATCVLMVIGRWACRYGKRVHAMKEQGSTYKKALFEEKLISTEKAVQATKEISALQNELAARRDGE